MILIVGLGNPGEQYEKTRHNAGFMALDYFQKANKLADFQFEKRLGSEILERKIEKEKVVLAKPQTFINNSGKTVGLIIKSYKIKTNNVWVIHDDADLELGAMRIVKNRGSGGHKGIESIMRALKSRDFVRFRIGTNPKVGKKQKKRSKKFMADFVLGKFSPSQEKLFQKTVKKCSQAIEISIKEGIDKAMNEFN